MKNLVTKFLEIEKITEGLLRALKMVRVYVLDSIYFVAKPS